MKTIAKYIPTAIAVVSGAYGLLNPAVIAAHPAITAVYTGLLGILNHFLPSPVSSNKGA